MADRMTPANAVGALYHAGSGEFLGSGFALRQPDCFVTAAHCVEGNPADRLRLHVPRSDDDSRVLEVVKHPNADIALLRLSRADCLLPFYDIRPLMESEHGVNLAAYGWSADVAGEDASKPVLRLFKGHFQRSFHFARGSYRYAAGELSFVAPRGLSGGPVFRDHHNTAVTALVAENLRSTLVKEDSVLERESPGRVQTTRYMEIVSFGVAVLLGDVRPWLDEHIPPYPFSALHL